MNLVEIVQTVIAVSALLLGLVYIIGGLIVNLHLSQYGLIEYQILQVKYLVVGLVFIPQILGITLIGAIPAFILVILPSWVLIASSVLSLTAGGFLIAIWAWFPKGKTSWLTRWNFWVLLSILSDIFPISVGLQQVSKFKTDPYSIILTVLAVFAFLMAIFGQLYHYSRFYYGKREGKFSDPIGMGVPMTVQLAGDAKEIDLLCQMGIPLEKPGITGPLKMLEETDAHYILGIGIDSEMQTLKVAKSIIKAILYQHDTRRK